MHRKAEKVNSNQGDITAALRQAVPDDGDDPMTYAPLSCVTVTRDELDNLRRRVEELEGENAALLDGRGQLQAALAAADRANAELRAGIATIEAHDGAIPLAVVRGYNRYRAAARNGVTPLDFNGWLAMLAGDENEVGGNTAESSFARARIREALGEGEEVQP